MQWDRARVDQANHRAALLPGAPIGRLRQPGEHLGKNLDRATGVGIRQGRANQFACAQMVVVLRVGVERHLQSTQAANPIELRVDQSDQMIPTPEALVVGIPVMLVHNLLKPAPSDWFKQTAKGAIDKAHARLSFLSLDNLKGPICIGRAEHAP